MSTFFKRIGTKKTVYSVDITVHSIKLSLSIEAGVTLIWKRKKKRIETSNKHKLQPSSGVLEINETLTMINTMYQDKSGDYIKKYAELTIQAHIDKKGTKKVGKAKIDLAGCVLGVTQQYYPVSDCADKKANICVSVKFSPIGESTMVDTMSEASGHSGISMGTDGDYSGPLFLDQDINELEEDLKKNTLTPGRPPRTKRKSENQLDAFSNVDNIAHIKVLEKENYQLKSEKDEIKLQFELISEKAKKERDQYCEYVGKLEKEIDVLARKKLKLKEKYKGLKEDSEENEKRYQETTSEFDEYRARYNHQDKKRLKDRIKTIELNLQKAGEDRIKAQSKVEEMVSENMALEETINSLKGLNAHLLKQLDSIRQESLAVIVPEIAAPEEEEPNASQNKQKKKLQEQLKKLKVEHKEAQEEIEELRTKQTEFISTIQQLKISHGTSEDELKEKLRKLENELNEKSSEIAELNSRLDEEIENSRRFERKTITVKEETDEKVTKLTQNLKVVASEKLALEVTYLNFQRKNDREKSVTETTVLAKLEGTIASNQKEIQRLQAMINEKDKQLTGALKSIERLESESSLYQDHLKAATVSEFSDPAVTILKEEIIYLEEKLARLEYSFSEEKMKLSETINILEKQMEIMDEKHKERVKEFSDKISSLTVENVLLKEKNVECKSLKANEFVSSMNEENYKQNIELLNIQILEYKNAASKLAEELKVAEQKYQDTKNLANKKEIDRENLQIKYREAQEQLREYSAQYTVLEVELYKINERFGQSLNSNNQLENEIQEIKEQIYNSTNKKKKS